MTPPDDLAMPFLLMSAFRGLVEEVHDDLAEAGYPGVRATHGFAMQAVGDGCTSVQLGQRLGVSKQAATRTAAALEDLGLVARVANTEDRRERRLVPTARGLAMLELSAQSFRRQVGQWRARHGEAAVDATLLVLAQADPGRRSATDLSQWA